MRGGGNKRLTDTALKLLGMLDAQGYVPDVSELSRKAGREEWQIRAALRELAEKEHIVYDPDNHFATKVVLGWNLEAEAERKQLQEEAVRRYREYEMFPGRNK